MSASWSSSTFTIVFDIRTTHQSSVLDSGLCLYSLINNCCKFLKLNIDYNLKFLLVSSNKPPSWACELTCRYPSLVRFWQYKIINKKELTSSTQWSTLAFYKIEKIIGQNYIWVSFDVANAPKQRFFSSRRYRKDRLVFIISGNLYSPLSLKNKLFPNTRYKFKLKKIIKKMNWISAYTDSGLGNVESLINKSKKSPINKLPFGVQVKENLKSLNEITKYRNNLLLRSSNSQNNLVNDQSSKTLWFLTIHDPIVDLSLNWLKEFNESIFKNPYLDDNSSVVYINISFYTDINYISLNQKSRVININPLKYYEYDFVSLLNCVDVFLYKKSDASFEINMLEALMAGCPTIFSENLISDLNFNKEIIPKHYFEKMHDLTPQNWAEHSINLLRVNPQLLAVNRMQSDLHKKYIDKIYNYYEKYYSWEKESKEWLLYFKKICEKIS